MKRLHLSPARLAAALVVLLAGLALPAQAQEPFECYVRHSSGCFLGDGGASAVLAAKQSAPLLRFEPCSQGGYNIAIKAADGSLRYLQLSGSWNTLFGSDGTSDNARFEMVGDTGDLLLIRCAANGKYLGTDGTQAGSYVFSDKSGSEANHYWFLAESRDAEPPGHYSHYLLNPQARRQLHQGWGVSLCWWANMCGKWSDSAIDQLIDWLVSPTGLNYNIFRYNIGGGDDPQNANCTPHHMGASGGKGLRAEMEGFKDSSEGGYIWERDSAQRKIMLKIRDKRPDAIFEAFSNSAPYYMTYSGCCAGNTVASRDNLRPEYYSEFAHYLVDVCKHYKEVFGIEFRTLDPFNEPYTSYWKANGGQEGCHFDYSSQIAFLKVLAPILQESRLQTVISAADETSVDASLKGFQEYQKAGVLNLVGQWNTHTYSGNNKVRSRLGSLTRKAGIRLWMSETGDGGSGIGGNLKMAQRLIDDVRYLAPAAWVDWQYVEEGNDQWCMVRGNFAAQSYERVKNYYVRQQFSRFIKAGYHFVSTPNEQTLAATNAAGDTLVLVALNGSAHEVEHTARLAFCDYRGSGLQCYRTTGSDNLRRITGIKISADGVLSFTLPALSVVTFVIPVTPHEQPSHEPDGESAYLIQPQYNCGLVLTAAGGGVTIEEAGYRSDWKAETEEEAEAGTPVSAAQSWTMQGDADGGLRIVNLAGDILTANGSAYALATDTCRRSGQLFDLTLVDGLCYKITLAGSNRALDLQGESYSTGTTVGLWEYGSTPDAGHRNWQLLRLPLSVVLTAIERPTLPATFRLQGRQLTVGSPDGGAMPCTLAIYTAGGGKVAERHFRGSVTLTLESGLYAAQVSRGQESATRLIAVK